jgi:hypothetical protein
MDGNPFAVFSARTFIYEALTVKRAQANSVGQVAAGYCQKPPVYALFWTPRWTGTVMCLGNQTASRFPTPMISEFWIIHCRPCQNFPMEALIHSFQRTRIDVLPWTHSWGMGTEFLPGVVRE